MASLDAGQGTPDNEPLLLPSWSGVQATNPPNRNPVLIAGVVRLGHIALIAGKGKIGKSWSAIELCVAVATGLDTWLGLPLLGSGRCLYIDPELDYKSLDNRFTEVSKAMGADSVAVDANVYKWCLRGVANANMGMITHDLRARCNPGDFALVVIDSCSCFVEGDENASTDIRAFFAQVLEVASITGATVLLVHHFGKAKDGDREAADRARGSSVWLDAPDAVMTITEILPPSGEPTDYLEFNEYACILEFPGIREFPRRIPKRLIFSHPVHREDDDGIVADWKPRSSTRDGGKATAKVNKAKAETNAATIVSKLLGHYYAEGVGDAGIIIGDAAKVCGCDVRTLEAAIDGCDYFTIEAVSARKRYVKPTQPPRASPEPLPMPD